MVTAILKSKTSNVIKVQRHEPSNFFVKMPSNALQTDVGGGRQLAQRPCGFTSKLEPPAAQL
jgi:hypothetical protein